MSIQSNNARVIEQLLAEQQVGQPEVINMFPPTLGGNAISPIDLSPDPAALTTPRTDTWSRDDPPVDGSGDKYAGATVKYQRVVWDDTAKKLVAFEWTETINSAGATVDISAETQVDIVLFEAC